MVWDLLVIGGGPGGMQAAIAAASEGLKVTVLERDKVGGQIGQTPKLENSVFAPAGGVPGPVFAEQMKAQAERMGAEIRTLNVSGLFQAEPGIIGVRTENRHRSFLAQNVILAMGSAWHHLDIPGLKPQLGKTVHYGPVQCLTVDCVGQEVAVFGGGPSAGQAIIELAHKAKTVHVLMRSTLKMPQYLVDRIHSLPNVKQYEHVRIGAVRVDRDGALLIDLGGFKRVSVSHLFMCSGLTPATSWLKGAVQRDDNGRITVGGKDRQSLETSMEGVFAIGDCRVGSTPRVGVAIGDGSLAVTQVWQRFMDNPTCTNCKAILA